MKSLDLHYYVKLQINAFIDTAGLPCLQNATPM